MCEFCHQHGEGKKWYLRAELYASDLLSDLNRRRYISKFFQNPAALKQKMHLLDKFNRLPVFVRAALRPILLGKSKRTHFGQVIPIEDVDEIFSFVNAVVRLPCVCRKAVLGTEERYCYGLSMAPVDDSPLVEIIGRAGADYIEGPDAAGLEPVAKEEALSQLKLLEGKGLFHSVWTFITPFIGGICNCDRDCLAMQATTEKAYPLMFRAEYVASVDPERCSGCRGCIGSCQFGAIRYSLARKRVDIDPRRCYGCGICRAGCGPEAISLLDRREVQSAANLW